jgi:hypothetical protein
MGGSSKTSNGGKSNVYNSPTFGPVNMGKKMRQQMAVAEYQGNRNQEAVNTQTEANRVNQVSPDGSVNWTNDPDKGWTQTTTLSPEAQAAYDSQSRIKAGLSGTAEDMLGGIGDTYSKPMDWDSLSAAGTPATAPGGYDEYGAGPKFDRLSNAGLGEMPGADDATRQRVEDAYYSRAKSRLDPQWEQEKTNRLDRLYAMGGREFDPGFELSMGNFARDKNDAYTSAQNEAIIGGGAEQSRLFDLGMKRRQQGWQETGDINTQNNAASQQEWGNANLRTDQSNTLTDRDYSNRRLAASDLTAERQRQVEEMMMKRSQPLNELTALLNGREIGMPGFSGTPNSTAGAAEAGNFYGAYTDVQAANAAKKAADANRTAGLASSAMGMFSFSDRRLKSNIVRIGATPAGYGVYSYDIFGEPSIGVMADEVPAEWTALHPSGYLMVNYSRVR